MEKESDKGKRFQSSRSKNYLADQSLKITE